MTYKMDASPNPSVSIGYALINTNVHIKKKNKVLQAQLE